MALNLAVAGLGARSGPTNLGLVYANFLFYSQSKLSTANTYV